LLPYQTIQPHQKALCPRCGQILYKNSEHSIEKILAITLTGLLLFLPANLLPIMQLSALGAVQKSTLFTGCISLFHNGFLWIAFLVLCFSVFIPLVKLILLFVVSLALYSHTPIAALSSLFKLYLHLDEWGMLEVYLLSLIVAFVKLNDMADIAIGIGFYCFVALQLIVSLLSSLLDEHQFWESIESNQQ
jgi:paraquat-inducible protein A